VSLQVNTAADQVYAVIPTPFGGHIATWVPSERQRGHPSALPFIIITGVSLQVNTAAYQVYAVIPTPLSISQFILTQS